MWSTIYKGVGVELGAGNEVITHKEGHVLACKRYKKWETTIVSVSKAPDGSPYNYWVGGISQVGADYGNFVGSTAHGYGITQDGWVVHNSALIDHIGCTIVAGDDDYEGDKVKFILINNALEIYVNGDLKKIIKIGKGKWLPADGAQIGGGTKSVTVFG